MEWTGVQTRDWSLRREMVWFKKKKQAKDGSLEFRSLGCPFCAVEYFIREARNFVKFQQQKLTATTIVSKNNVV